MRKLLSLVVAMMCAIISFAATETTVFYSAPEATIGTYTVKLNVNFKGDGDDWSQMTMTKTKRLNGEDPVYSATFTDKYDGVGVMQFQLYDGATWKSQDVAISSWTSVSTYNGKMIAHANPTTWVAAPAEPVEKVTYTALKADPSTGNWAGRYLIVFADNKAHATVSGSDLAATSDVLTITSGETEINSTDAYYVTVEPFADGYSIKLPSGKYLSVNANSNKVAEVNAAYAFNFEYTASGIKIFGKDTKGNTRYVLNNSTYYRGYTWNDSYKLPTLYRTGDEAPALQTIYFLNSLDWTTVKAFVWPATGDAYKPWSGEAMYNTKEQVDGKYIYAYRFPATYANIIFNNGAETPTQTADLEWAATKPYFVLGATNGEGKYEGSWYASKAEIPTTKYYIIGSMNGWDKKTPIEMTPGNGDSLSVDIPLIGDYHYEFKVLKVLGTDTAWLGDQNGGIMDKSNCKGWTISKDYDKNIGLQTTKEANYKFIFDKGKVQISVVIPEGGTVVPETATALLKGVFSIAANGTAKFSRGNLQYNQGAKKWYFAEKQYDMIAEKNIHLGNENYSGSIDLFSWNCATAENGIKLSNKDADFTGAFVDWTGLFAGDIKYSTLSKAEWDYLMARKKDGKALWTMAGLGPDSIIGLILFPDDWTAPTGIAIEYGIPSLSVKVEWPHRDIPKHNLYTFEQWATLEAAGAVFLPAGGERAGYWGNKIGFNGVDENTNPASWNPEANNTYSWAENANEYGMYWLSTQGISKEHYAYYVILPAWSDGPDTSTSDDDFYYYPAVWQREKRRGNSVRLVEKTYLPEYYIAGSMTEWAKNMVKMTAGNGDSLSVDINLDEKEEYTFKVVKVVNTDTTWYGLKINEGDPYEPMTYENCKGWYLYDNGNKNVKLQTTKNGSYKFIFEKNANNEISIVMPEPDPIDTTWYIAGGFNNWAAGMEELKGEKADSLILKVELKSDTIVPFKLVRVRTQAKVNLDTVWFGVADKGSVMKNGDKDWWLLETGYENVGLQPTKIGEYTFVVDPTHRGKVGDEENVLAPIINVIMPEPDPIKMKEITLVPRIWNEGGAKFAAHYWETGKPAAWSAFFTANGTGDTLKAEINEKADNIIFVRFSNEATVPAWENVWNQTEDLKVGESWIFTITGWGEGENPKSVGQWTPYEEPGAQYGLLIDGTTFIGATLNPTPADPSQPELMATNVNLTAGQTFKLYDSVNKQGWVIPNWKSESYQFTITNDVYEVTETGLYHFYVHAEYEISNSWIYVAKEGGTGCENINGAVELRKVIENGVMYIYRDGMKYTVQGYIVR